jgi:ATP-dependent DNA helicase RecG
VKLVCKDIAETLVAFANADGGELFVGVEDDGIVSGVHYKDAQFAMLSEAFRTHTHPDTPLPSPTVARINHESLTVLYFQVPKSTQKVHLTADGRCLQRFDRENRPVAAEQIQYSRQEQLSREYDRAFIDGAGLQDLDRAAIEEISKRIAGGQSPEKFLQFMDTAQYDNEGLALRRAAALLFANDVTRWHPRCEVRIVRVSGTALGVGKDYNVHPRDDQTVRGNILMILERAWDILRPYLTQTKLVESGIFKENLVYPEDACREALINAVAHRDYSIEGKGIEIFIYDDRLEVKSPGGLLSSISLADLRSGKRTHQSRNAYICRVLRELGYMREMGEGMLRIYATMRDRDLAPPELDIDAGRFDLVLHHKSVFSPKDQEWLQAYSLYNLSRDEQRAILLGRDGHLLSTNAIINALGIADVDEFRKVVENLRRKGILYTALDRQKTQKAFRTAKSKREIGRFAIRPPDQTEQYRQELLRVLAELGERRVFAADDMRTIQISLSPGSPYKENLADSLKLLGLVDERMKPLPLLSAIWSTSGALSGQKKEVSVPVPRLRTPLRIPAKRSTRSEIRSAPTHLIVAPVTVPFSGEQEGSVAVIKYFEEYGFIRCNEAGYYFRKSDLVDPQDWPFMRFGTVVAFTPVQARAQARVPPAKEVRILRQPSKD